MFSQLNQQANNSFITKRNFITDLESQTAYCGVSYLSNIEH